MMFRPFADTDYPALADFLTRLHPGEPKSAGSMRRFDAGRGEHHARVLAWEDNLLVGVAETERSRQFTQPGWYGLHVHPSDPELRIVLEQSGMETLRPLNPGILHTSVSEDWPEYAELTARGWREHERMWLSHLDLTTFEPAAFGGRRARSQAARIEVRTLTELGWTVLNEPGLDEVGLEALQRRLYGLTIELLSDVPTTDPITPWPFEVWRERVLGHPGFTPDGPLIAVHGPDWVGLTELYLPRPEAPGTLHQGLTGVRRAWRGRGAAWALKLAAAERAKIQGWQSVRTGNHIVNREMLGINAVMGFVRGPARVVLIREWKA